MIPCGRCNEVKGHTRRRPISQNAPIAARINTTAILVFLYITNVTFPVSIGTNRLFSYADAFGNLASSSKTQQNRTHGLFQTVQRYERTSLSSQLPFTSDVSRDKKREHYNDALLNRIITGRKSASSRWRKRTRRAAAALGIQRQHKTEQDYREDQEQIYKEMITQRPTVPPPSSTIFKAVGLEEKTKSQTPSPISSPSKCKQPHLTIRNFHKRRRRMTQEQHARAKLEWAAKYTSIHTLRQSFGRNRNKIWGDFDPQTTRKLYHTLLPRALLGLYEVGLWSPKDLAPLAFEARVAAKKYARERCILPGRLASMAYDGFRSWRRWGTWSVEGMSWEQIWNKYETQILEEYMEDNSDVDLDELQEEITAQICLRILERSCITNETVDKMFLNSERNESKDTRRNRRRNAERDLEKIKIKLERDMKELLAGDEQLSVVTRKSSPFYLDILGEKLPNSMSLGSSTYAGSQDVGNEEQGGGILSSVSSKDKVLDSRDRKSVV